MRELPDDFDEKLRSYIDIGSKIIAQYNVPPELVVGCDETNVQLVPRTISHAFAEHGRFREIREIAAALRASQENIVIPNAAYENEIETTQEIDRIGILEDDDLDSASDAPDLSDEDKSSDEDIYAEDEGDDENEQLNVRGLFLKLGLHGKPKAN